MTGIGKISGPQQAKGLEPEAKIDQKTDSKETNKSIFGKQGGQELAVKSRIYAPGEPLDPKPWT